MKIETCSNTRDMVTFLGTAIIVGLVIAFVVDRIVQYNKIAYERGYTQQQMIGSQTTMWVKPSE